MTHVQSCYFANVNLLPFCRCRFRRCMSSLLKLPKLVIIKKPKSFMFIPEYLISMKQQAGSFANF